MKVIAKSCLFAIGLLVSTGSTISDTDAMLKSGITWAGETLDEFITSPFGMIRGTGMGFVGIPFEREHQQLITFLSQLDGSNIQCK